MGEIQQSSEEHMSSENLYSSEEHMSSENVYSSEESHIDDRGYGKDYCISKKRKNGG